MQEIKATTKLFYSETPREDLKNLSSDPADVEGSFLFRFDDVTDLPTFTVDVPFDLINSWNNNKFILIQQMA